MYICLCKGISESDVRDLGRKGITQRQELVSCLGLDDKDTCCGRCIKNIAHFASLATAEGEKQPLPVST